MKVLIFLAVLAASEAAAVVYTYPHAFLGHSTAFQSQDGFGNYAFGYHAGKPDSSSFHRETGSLGAKVGSYGVARPDGKVQVVDYVADAGGFRADIKTTEKDAAEAKSPADVTIKEAKLKTLPAVVSYVPHAYSYAVAGPSYHYVVY